jgi:hypothetical protein
MTGDAIGSMAAPASSRHDLEHGGVPDLGITVRIDRDASPRRLSHRRSLCWLRRWCLRC